jgi:large subunit ribosomal protein L9
MKVILLKDVAKVGRRFDTVTVPDGFALNKLIPRNLAQAATPENMKRLKNISEKVASDREAQSTEFAEIIEKLKDTTVTVAVEANNEGRMFQALKAEAVTAAVKEQTGCDLHAEHLVMKTPVKSTGEHTIMIHSGDLSGELHLMIEAK